MQLGRNSAGSEGASSKPNAAAAHGQSSRHVKTSPLVTLKCWSRAAALLAAQRIARPSRRTSVACLTSTAPPGKANGRPFAGQIVPEYADDGKGAHGDAITWAKDGPRLKIVQENPCSDAFCRR